MTPALERLDDVGRFGQRARVGIDDDAGPRHRFVVGFAHAAAESTDEVQVRSTPDPGAAHDRLRRRGRATDDVRAPHRAFQILHGLRGQPLVAQPLGHRLRALAAAAPDPQALEPPRACVRMRHEGGELSGADDQRVARIGAREVPCRQQRHGGGAPQRQRLTVDDRLRRARYAVEQHVDRVDRGKPARRIARHDGHQLDPECGGGPRGHQQQRVGVRQRMGMTQGSDRLGQQRAADRIGERVEVERRVDLRGREEAHQPAAPATKLPDRPPCFSSSRTSPMTMPRSTALHMS